jgi:hypothetical protein
MTWSRQLSSDEHGDHASSATPALCMTDLALDGEGGLDGGAEGADDRGREVAEEGDRADVPSRRWSARAMASQHQSALVMASQHQ